MTARQETFGFSGDVNGQAFASSTGYLPNALQPNQSRDAETLRHDGGAASRALQGDIPDPVPHRFTRAVR